MEVNCEGSRDDDWREDGAPFGVNSGGFDWRECAPYFASSGPLQQCLAAFGILSATAVAARARFNSVAPTNHL
ncbi:unnamed protein product [Gongylonema pulchrum]|uniref:Uncharacterized protein n=1 Tax=Gongylonema pulchrum TaxID=637853 RepID=A0A183EDB6_9BILA|nr:unnamed protein product [Gongylonema pulchrum]